MGRTVDGLGGDFRIVGNAVGSGVPNVAWDGVGADAAEAVRDAFGIAEGTEQGLDARAVDAGEEILQVEAEDDGFACVRLGEGADATAFDEAMSGGMGGDEVENVAEDLALEFADAGFRHLDQAKATVGFAFEAVAVVLELFAAVLLGEAVQAGEPIELFGGEPEPLGEVAQGFDGGQVPGLGGGDGPHAGRAGDGLGEGDCAGVSIEGAADGSVFGDELVGIAVARAGAGWGGGGVALDE